MKNSSGFCIFFCLKLFFFVFAVGGSKIFYKTEYIDVPLDHFGYAVNNTFKLRYLINDTFAKDQTGPILFYTGNEGDIELFAENTGFIWESAGPLGARVVFAEHRFYGKSLPFGNRSYESPGHLGYLTSEQALADFAHLLRVLNPEKSENGDIQRPVIAVGGSYGGMLAAWFRMKYPHLVTGALAASAPILQFSELTPCNIFNRILTSIFKTAYTEDCATNVRRSWDVLKALSANDTGRSELNQKFNLCKPLTKPEEIDDLFNYLVDVYGNLAMANYPYENTFLAPLPAYPVRMFCGQLAKKYPDSELVDAIQKALKVYTNYSTNCINISSAYDETMGIAGWDFQACTEMVMPMCADGKDDMFFEQKWDSKKYSDECFKRFGVRPREQSAVTTYGGKHLEFTSNIIFSNGLLDPWSGGGVLRTTNNKLKIVIIPDGAHHLDLRGSNPRDPTSVIEARKVEIRIIKSWIEDYWNNVA